MTIGTIPHLTDVAVKQQLPTAKHSAFKAPSSPILADSFPGTISTVNTLTSYQTKNTMIPCQDRHPATNSQRLFTCRLKQNGDNIITKSPLTSLFRSLRCFESFYITRSNIATRSSWQNQARKLLSTLLPGTMVKILCEEAVVP